MRWAKIRNSERTQPSSGMYRDWKPQVARSCSLQCVYCAISESRFGGIRNFHVEHYRPKSRHEFAHLENVITNLYYACSICNGFKGPDWPAEPKPDYSNPSYPDPAETDYNELFNVNTPSFELTSRYPAGTYVIERVFLNRPQLLSERRLSEFLAWAQQVPEDVMALFDRLTASAASSERDLLLRDLCDLLAELSGNYHSLMTARPYKPEDIKRR